MVTIIKDKVMVGKRWGCILTEDKEGGGSGVDAKLGGLNFLSKISIWKLNCGSTPWGKIPYNYKFQQCWCTMEVKPYKNLRENFFLFEGKIIRQIFNNFTILNRDYNI